MALFPAYNNAFNQEQKSADEIVEVPNLKCPKSWLTNQSFAPKSPTIEHEIASTSNIDLEIIYEAPETSIPDKKRKKHRKSEKRSEKRHKKIKVEKPKHEKIDSIFIQTDSLTSSSKNLYVYDMKRDIENLHFGSVYKKQRALFSYKIKRCLGGNERINSLMFADEMDSKKKKAKEKRYFNRKLQKIGADPLQFIMGKPSSMENNKWNFDEEFLPIEAEMEINDEKYIYDPKIQMYRPITSSTNMNESSLLEDIEEISLDNIEIARENKRFNKMLAENPNDIELWKKFLDFQDRFYEINARRDNVKLSKLALLERKLAILDKAMQQNANSYELKLLRMDFGLEAGWDREKLNNEWKKLEFNHINQPSVWIGRLKFAYSHFSHFTVGRQASLFDHCLEKLNVVLKNQLITHPCLPHSEDFFVEFIVAKIVLWKNSGHFEKSIALFQALLEFNFRQPEIVKRLTSLDEKRKFFEPFWDANCPRLGENDALGWSQVMEMKTTSQPETGHGNELDKLEEEICCDSTKNESKVWLDIENLRQSYHWRPFKGVEEPEDSERIVLLDDIQDCLYEITESHNRFFLILKCLKVFGVQFSSLFSSNATSWYDDDAQNSLEIFENLPKLEKMTTNLKTFEGFLSNVFEQIVSFDLDKEQKMYLVCLRFYHLASSLSTNGDIPQKEKLKIFTKVAKEILSKDFYRQETVLYLAYAEGLCKLGFMKEALNVLTTTLNNMNSNVFSLSLNSFDQLVYLNLVNLLINCRLKDLKDVENSGDLTKLLARFAVHGHFLKNDDEDANIVRAKKCFSVIITRLQKNFSIETSSFIVAWLGDALTLTTNLYAVYSYCLTKNIKNVIEQFTSCIDYLEELKISFDNSDLRYLAIDRNVERSCENEMSLVKFHMEHYFGPPKLLNDCVTRCLRKYPANGTFLKVYCDLNLRVQLISKLRRFFSEPLTARPIWWIAAVYAEFTFYLKIKESNSFCETHKMRNVFENALEKCHNNCVLWHLCVKMASLWNNNEAVKKLLYQGIRQCPGSKELFMEAIHLFPNDVQTFVDLMTEKELRVRLPFEELKLLLEASRNVNMPVENNFPVETLSETNENVL